MSNNDNTPPSGAFSKLSISNELTTNHSTHHPSSDQDGRDPEFSQEDLISIISKGPRLGWSAVANHFTSASMPNLAAAVRYFSHLGLDGVMLALQHDVIAGVQKPKQNLAPKVQNCSRTWSSPPPTGLLRTLVAGGVAGGSSVAISDSNPSLLVYGRTGLVDLDSGDLNAEVVPLEQCLLHPSLPAILSVGAYGQVQLQSLDASSGWTVVGHSNGMTSLVLLSETLLATSCASGELALWTCYSSQDPMNTPWVKLTLLETVLFPMGIRVMMKVSENTLAIGGSGKVVSVVRVETTEDELQARVVLVSEFEGHTGLVTAMTTVDAGSDWLVTGGHDRVCRIWPSGRTFLGHAPKGNIWAMVSVAGGSRVVSAGTSASLLLWDPMRPQQGAISCVLAHEVGGIRSLTLNPTGDRLYSAGYDGALKEWDVQALVHATPRPWLIGPVTCCDVLLGGEVVAGTSHGYLIVWNEVGLMEVNNSEAEDTFSEGIASIYGLPDGTFLAAGLETGIVLQYSTSFEKLWKLELLSCTTASTLCPLNANGDVVFIGEFNGWEAWNVSTRELLMSHSEECFYISVATPWDENRVFCVQGMNGFFLMDRHGKIEKRWDVDNEESELLNVILSADRSALVGHYGMGTTSIMYDLVGDKVVEGVFERGMVVDCEWGRGVILHKQEFVYVWSWADPESPPSLLTVHSEPIFKVLQGTSRSTFVIVGALGGVACFQVMQDVR